jgi:hypothetical protein
MRYPTVVVLVIVMIAGPAVHAVAQEGQTPSSAPSTTTTTPNGTPETDATANPDALPFNVDRIQRVLSKPPVINADRTRLVYRIEVFGRKPTIAEILGPDYLKGPALAGPMTHQEFLNMVTPKDVQGYAAFDNKQGMIVAATSFALQWALRQAVQKLQDAKTERQKEAARKEVDEALAALRKARRDAGLPD